MAAIHLAYGDWAVISTTGTPESHAVQFRAPAHHADAETRCIAEAKRLARRAYQEKDNPLDYWVLNPRGYITYNSFHDSEVANVAVRMEESDANPAYRQRR